MVFSKIKLTVLQQANDLDLFCQYFLSIIPVGKTQAFIIHPFHNACFILKRERSHAVHSLSTNLFLVP